MLTELNSTCYSVKYKCKTPKESNRYLTTAIWDRVEGPICNELGSFTLDRIQNAVIHKVLQEGYSVNWI